MNSSCDWPVLANARSQKSDSLDSRWQLATYSDEALIDNAFSVNTTMSDEFVYLVWKDSQEEVILQVDGILVEAHHPPVISNGTEYSFVFLIL